MDRTSPARPITHRLVRTLGEVPELADLDDDLLLELAGIAATLRWSAGSVVFDHDEPAEDLYVVLKGTVRTACENGDGDDLGPGDHLGRKALEEDARRIRRAEALEDSELLVLPRDDLAPLLAAHPDLRARLVGGGG